MTVDDDLSADDADEMTTPAELAELEEKLETKVRHLRELRFLRLERGREKIAELRAHPDVDLLQRRVLRVDPVAIMKDRHHNSPERLAEVVREVARFTDDREVIVRTAVEWARDCEISEEHFVPAIVAALKALPVGGHRRVG